MHQLRMDAISKSRRVARYTIKCQLLLTLGILLVLIKVPNFLFKVLLVVLVVNGWFLWGIYSFGYHFQLICLLLRNILYYYLLVFINSCALKLPYIWALLAYGLGLLLSLFVPEQLWIYCFINMVCQCNLCPNSTLIDMSPIYSLYKSLLTIIFILG